MRNLLFFFLILLSGQIKAERAFIDLHNHMFGHEAWDGGWYHGTPDGPESVALSPCSGNESFFGDHHGTAIHPWITQMMFKTSDVGLSHPKSGYPNYVSWPKWDTVAHQQMWEGHLKQAWKTGLRMMIVSFYNNEPICRLMTNKARYKDCSDMAAVDRQFDAYEKFLKGNDLNDPKLPLRSEWIVQASSFEEAQRLMKTGKLIVIPSIEVSNLFPNDNGGWRVQLDKYYQRGLRTLQIVHQFNNRFAGAAIHENVLKLGQFLSEGKFFELKNGFNQLGLTAEGKELIQEMMKRKMLIDIAHLSEAGVRDVIALTTKEGAYYPTYNSHTHTRVMMSNKRASFEKSSPDHLLLYHKQSGGMIGLRTGDDSTHSFEAGKRIPNDCQGSTKSFAQSYLYNDVKLQIPMGFATDLNGFITQIKPRFGKEAHCEKPQDKPLGRRFDESGFGHIGQISDILDDIENFGVELTNLEQSAYTFLGMWEKVDNPGKRNKVSQPLARGN